MAGHRGDARGAAADGTLDRRRGSTGRDALELVAAGASAVQVGTATFNDPTAPRRVVDELEAEIARHGFVRFADVVGIAHERKARP